MKLGASDTIYRDGNSWQAIRYTEMGTDDWRCDIQRWELLIADAIYRVANWWLSIGYTEMGIDDRQYDIQRWK